MPSTTSHSTPRISIVMPAYNTAHLIAGSLDSVFQQTFRDFEVLVVNDGSPDTPQLEKELERYLSAYPEKMVYIRQENKRAAGARNTAIRSARGEFLAFLDSDDSWSRDHLASQMNLFEEDSTLEFVYSNGLSVGDPSRPSEFMRRCPSHGTADFEALVVERCQIPVSTVVARKSTIVRAGLFDETLPRCDDYDMWLRTAFYGAKFGYTERVQARLNGGRPGSLGASRVRMAEAYLNILEKTMKSLPLSESQRTLVENRTKEVRALYCLEEGKYRLQQRDFDQAKNYLREANLYFRRSKVSLVLLGLAIAPKTTSRLASLMNEIHN